MDDLDTSLAQDVEPGGIAIRLAVIDASDVRFDDHLGAHHAGRGADEHHLARQLRAGFDQRVLLRVDAATISWLSGVAAVRQAAGVAVVADAQDLGRVAGCDHAADLQPGAGGPLRELLCHAHVDLFQRYAIGLGLGLLDGFYGCHFPQVNTLVYTHFQGYNAPHVAIRTIVRAPPCMCAGWSGRRGPPRLEPHAARRRPGCGGGGAAPAPRDGGPGPGVPRLPALGG